MKVLSILICALMMSVMVGATSFAHEVDCDDASNTKDYKAVPKAMHEQSFPSGHPATEAWMNHCYWDEKENGYQYRSTT